MGCSFNVENTLINHIKITKNANFNKKLYKRAKNNYIY